MGEEFRFLFTQLDQPAGVHDRDAVAHVADHAHGVRDEDIGELVFILQVLQQVEDLGLDGHIQRRDRLIGDHQLGVDHQRAGNADALALPTAEAVRETPQVLDAQAHLQDHLGDPVFQLSPVGDAR